MHKTHNTLLNWDNMEVFPLHHIRNSCRVNFTSGENRGLVEGLVDEHRHAVHATWSREVKEQCMKDIKRFAKYRNKVNRQKHGKKLVMGDWKLL